MPTFKITIAYDGAGFCGWQRQASAVSVQGVLEEAASALDERAVTVIGAGRTDAGVHALGQIAAFTLVRSIDAAAVARALNARLPDTIRIVGACEVPESFHPQFDARAKTYRYRMWNAEAMNPFERRYAWHLPGRLDVGAMSAAARLLEGQHDFAAFQGSGSDVATTVRTMAASRIIPAGADRGGLVCYETTGSGFLRHMVRAIVGSLVDVGRGRQPIEWIGRVLASRDRAMAGQTAPAHGLFLVGVDYDAAPADTATGTGELAGDG